MKRQLWVCLPALAAIFAAIILAGHAGRALREPRYRARARRFAATISPRHTERPTSRISPTAASPHSQSTPLDRDNRTRCQGSAACARLGGSLALPLSFEPNVGQANPEIEFIGRGEGLTLFLTHDAISIAVPAGESENRIAKVVTLRTSWTGNRRKSSSRSTGHKWKSNSRGARNGHRSRSLVPKGSSRLRHRKKRAWRGMARQRGVSNYLIGRDPRHWHTQVPHFERVEAANWMRGVNASVYDNGDNFEYDLRLAPGIDPSKLRLEFSGADTTRLAENGDLLLNVGGRELRIHKPSAYQFGVGPSRRKNLKAAVSREPPRRIRR